MAKKIDPKDKKQDENKNRPTKPTSDHSKEYEKKHEKGHFPRKVWPTDSEKNKGPKI